MVAPGAIGRKSYLSPLTMDSRATNFFHSLLIWNDVLHNSARRQNSVATEIYHKFLSNNEFAKVFCSEMNCEAWVFEAIMDSTSLSIWKSDQEAQGVLSIRELVSKAESIEIIVESKLAIVQDMIDASCVEKPPQGAYLNTYLFAHALLIHLHGIVSGTWPELSEIKSSVDEAVIAWQLHVQLLDLRTLAWPFLVTASVASGTHRDFFRKVISDCRSKPRAIGSAFPWDAIIEDCWRGFDKRGSDRDVGRCDWKNILQKLDLTLLFI